MGVRELKAARTRQQILDVALDLFLEQGYDATTMEQIAEQVGIGATTLYRYFPSKDLLILHPFERWMDLATPLRERPAEEPLDVALGVAIHEVCGAFDDKAGRLAEVRGIVDNAPVPRARLWDLAARSQGDLESAIAERMRRPAGDLQVAMTAHITFAVYQITVESWWAGDRRASAAATARKLLRKLGTLDLVVPASPADTAARSRRIR
ncbi:TetR/AcrR family transcriptional regulator [Flindersiella endophytica]